MTHLSKIALMMIFTHEAVGSKHTSLPSLRVALQRRKNKGQASIYLVDSHQDIFQPFKIQARLGSADSSIDFTREPHQFILAKDLARHHLFG